MQIIQDFIAKLDLYLPWLLPTLETIEQAFPATARIAICAVLMAGFFFMRHRNLASSARHVHLAAL